MAERQSGRKVVSALLLLLGFYVMALGVIAALVITNVAVWQSGRFSGQLAVFSVVTVFVLITSVFFVQGGFQPPQDGAHIDATRQPDLFVEISAIAEQMDTKQPDHVYLIPDVNAYVVEDTMFLGLVTKKRTLAIGLGLLQAMTIDEFRAILAHEFGHYAGGHTRLAAVAYRGWESIVRALQQMGDGLLRSTFVAYAKFYRRMTTSTGRAQELAADEWAARIGGTDAAARALSKIESATFSYQMYIDLYVEPLMSEQARPANFFEGLRSFAQSSTWAEQAEVLRSRVPVETSAYDTHPPTSDRVAAIRALPPIPHIDDSRPALSLIRQLDVVELAVSEALFNIGRQFDVVEWDQAGSRIADGYATKGREIMRIADIGSGRGRQGFFDLLEDRQFETLAERVGADLTAETSPEDTIHPYVRLAVINLVRENTTWQVDWSGPSATTTTNQDIEDLTDRLIAGGDRSAAARGELDALAHQGPSGSPLAEDGIK